MILAEPMSALFWSLYIYCFLSDILDGYIARKKQIVSNTGALLDSVADIVFFFAVLISLLPVFVISQWLLFGMGIIVLIRLLSYIIGFIKYHSFASLHTWLNKLTGFLVIISPLLLIVIDLKIIEIILGGIALVSSVEELLIIIRSKKLNRDVRGIWDKGNSMS